MPSSNGKISTSSAAMVTVLDVDGPKDGTLSIWTFDPASGAGTLYINGDAVVVDAGDFSLQTRIYAGRVLVQLQRSGETNMTNWQALLVTQSGT